MKRWSFLILVVVAVVAMTSIAYNRPTAVEQPKETIATATNSAITKPQSSETSIVNPEPVAPVRISPTTRNLLSELQDYQECYFRSDCVTPESDARAAHFFVAQQITDRLDRLVALTHQQTTSDDEFVEIAKQFLSFPDGRVQEQALVLMGSMPPKDGGAQAIMSALRDHHDARLFELAMVELQRYPNDYRATDDFLIETLRTGGHYVSQVVARQLLPVLREDNIERYEQTAAELPPNTAKARYLKQVLNEYRLLQQGG